MKDKKETILSKLTIIPNVAIKILYKDIEIRVTSYGDKYWYKNNKLHNENGPAVIYEDGEKRWYLDGQTYPEKDWRQLIEKQKR